jgi:hypothetical protein
VAAHLLAARAELVVVVDLLVLVVLVVLVVLLDKADLLVLVVLVVLVVLLVLLDTKAAETAAVDGTHNITPTAKARSNMKPNTTVAEVVLVSL